MIFPRKWKKYPKRKPKEDGYYEVTYRYDIAGGGVEVISLYYSAWEDKWVDKSRLSVFDGYKVYKPCKAPIDDNRVYSDVRCDLSLGVVAWRALCKPYSRVGFGGKNRGI